MRAFAKGTRFMNVKTRAQISITVHGKSAKKVQEIPVFSEPFLYPRVGKEDARFILGVAEEYDALILMLGEKVVQALLERWRDMKL